MSAIQTITFAQLVASDEINARTTGKKDAIDELAASIAAKGLIQPLAVRPADTGASAKGPQRYEIIDGRRRYQALALLIRQKQLKRDTPVPVLVRDEDDAEALETSLMANVVRLPMHPVDQHEVFARIAEGGVTPAGIAARFGIAERTVKQHLALGRLAPEVREAWRKGRMNDDAARAFAIEPSPEKQAAALERLGRGRQIDGWLVRNELSVVRERVDQSDEIAFIGEAAYLAAGGRIDDDLFDEARYVADVPLAKRLARDKLQAHCDRLKAGGWSWAEIEEVCGFNNWDCQHVLGEDYDGNSIPEAEFSAEQRARSGCLVSIGMDGKVHIEAGLLRRDYVERRQDEQADEFDEDDRGGDLPAPASEADTGPAAADPFAVSQVLLEDITKAQTAAAAEALGRYPDLTLAVAVAALGGPRYGTPAKLFVSQDAHQPTYTGSGGTFAQQLKARLNSNGPALLAELAGIVAGSLQLTVKPGTRRPDHDDHLIAALPSADYLRAMRAAFNPADYFGRSRKDTAIAALEEMHDAGYKSALLSGNSIETLKKADLAQWAAEQAAACGWLPPQLRHPAYVLDVPMKPEKPARSRGKMAAAEQSSEPEAPAPSTARRSRVRA